MKKLVRRVKRLNIPLSLAKPFRHVSTLLGFIPGFATGELLPRQASPIDVIFPANPDDLVDLRKFGGR